jgi:hypothetical protein
MQADLHIMFFCFYDFLPQIAEIYIKRMANDLFFFVHKIHITYLQTVFSKTARMPVQTGYSLKRALVKTSEWHGIHCQRHFFIKYPSL